jgi:dsDNA-specific endonuclease/ATPase MutS2
MQSTIDGLENIVCNNSKHISDLSSRQELENLDKTAKESLDTMQKLLSVAEEQRDILQEIAKHTKDARYVIPSYSRRSYVPDLTP